MSRLYDQDALVPPPGYVPDDEIAIEERRGLASFVVCSVLALTVVFWLAFLVGRFIIK